MARGPEHLPGGGPALGVVVVAQPWDRRSAPDLGRLLAHSGLAVPVLGTIALDPRAAEVVQGRWTGRYPAGCSCARCGRWSARCESSPTCAASRTRELSAVAVDQVLVRRLREEVADLLARQRRDDAAAGAPPMTAEDERQFARAVISQVLDAYARTEVTAGRTPPTPQDEEEIAAGIHAALFGVGRLQPLLDDPEVENIDINGCDQVFVGYADGREVRMPPVADSDEELVELVQILGAYSGLSAGPSTPPTRSWTCGCRTAAGCRR